MLSIRSQCRDIIKHFTNCKTNRYKEYYIQHTREQLTQYVQSGGCPKTKHPFIYIVYTYILIFTQYIMTIYISKLCYRQRKNNNTYKNTTRIKHTSPRLTKNLLPLPTAPPLLLGKICQRSFLGCNASTSCKAL